MGNLFTVGKPCFGTKTDGKQRLSEDTGGPEIRRNNHESQAAGNSSYILKALLYLYTYPAALQESGMHR